MGVALLGQGLKGQESVDACPFLIKEWDGLRLQFPILDHEPISGHICVFSDVEGTAWPTSFSLLSPVAGSG